MLNESYILRRMMPLLNERRELSEIEFFELFSELTLQEQYEIVNLMIAHDIALVETKEETQSVPADTTGSGFEGLLHLTNEQLCAMARQGDSRAAAAVLRKNEQFVWLVTNRLARSFGDISLTEEDLFQEGCIGLLDAARRFDPATGYRFLTYSGYWIRQRVVRAVVNHGYLIRLPVHVFEKIRMALAYRRKAPIASVTTLVEMIQADHPELTEDRILFYLRSGELYLNTTSLNELVGEDDDTELMTLLPDETQPGVEETVEALDLRRVMEDALQTLNHRERLVLMRRFGLDGGVPQTLEEVGRELHVTRERIRQIEVKAMNKLRRPSVTARMKDFIA